MADINIGINEEIVGSINEFCAFAKKVVDKIEDRNSYAKSANSHIDFTGRKIIYYLNGLYVIFKFTSISMTPAIDCYRVNFEFDDWGHYAFYNLISYMTVKLNDAFRAQVLEKKCGIPKTLLFDEYLPREFKPTKVIWNDPATIVYWSDGDKTVVKVDNWDYPFDEEKGLAMAIVKKMFGYKDFYKILRGACYVRDGSNRVVWEEKK